MARGLSIQSRPSAGAPPPPGARAAIGPRHCGCGPGADPPTRGSALVRRRPCARGVCRPEPSGRRRVRARARARARAGTAPRQMSAFSQFRQPLCLSLGRACSFRPALTFLMPLFAIVTSSKSYYIASASSLAFRACRHDLPSRPSGVKPRSFLHRNEPERADECRRHDQRETFPAIADRGVEAHDDDARRTTGQCRSSVATGRSRRGAPPTAASRTAHSADPRSRSEEMLVARRSAAKFSAKLSAPISSDATTSALISPAGSRSQGTQHDRHDGEAQEREQDAAGSRRRPPCW